MKESLNERFEGKLCWVLLTLGVDFGVPLFNFTEETQSFIPFFDKKRSPQKHYLVRLCSAIEMHHTVSDASNCAAAVEQLSLHVCK